MTASSRRLSDEELCLLNGLAKQFPNIDSAIAEIARLSAVQTLPKGSIHIISDIHGEHKKLRHVINNASGTLRPLIEKLLGPTLGAFELEQFVTLTFYPAEVVERLEREMTDPRQLHAYAMRTLRLQFELVRHLVTRYSLRRAMHVFPLAYRDLLTEMLNAPTTERGNAFVDAIIDELMRHGRALHLIHIVGRLIRNLAIYELIIAGDCWDRGPRGDLVVDYLRQQPNVSIIWGNHDVAWIGACLGHDALICHVLRVSLRYRRLAQIDEGYSIPLTPLEHLARECSGDDPATHFYPKSQGTRPMVLVARMQKAIAVMQFKLEGQMIERNPQWGMAHRRILHRIDHAKGTIDIDGHVYDLRDKFLPTLDPKNPYELSAEEKVCMHRMKQSFHASQKLWEHTKYIVNNGSMYLVRDEHLIFHGCVPCCAEGNFLPMPINGQELAGREMFEAIDRTVIRAVDKREQPDLDVLWYLWSGPCSPLFGKDRIATFERDFIEDKHTHHETQDPYFDLINDAPFCDKVLREFGVDSEHGLIVNGHVPVKIEKGESPMKKSGKAITIDGAFSEAYGDHGYTLVLEPDRTLLAKHHHFESIDVAIAQGVDIVPEVQVIRTWNPPRRIADTERGRDMAININTLEKLIEAYQTNRIRQA